MTFSRFPSTVTLALGIALIVSIVGPNPAEALDGFTATLKANAGGWSLSTTGLPSLAPLSGGYGGSNFLALFDGGRATATVQGPGSGATMTVNSIAVTVVPEPATLLIWSLLAGLGVGLGWRRRK